MTVVTANPDNDKGNPKEITTRYNHDPSWEKEVDMFIDCVINNKKITHGNSDDAFKTMKLVYKIYYQDVSWRKKYHIADPNIS